MPRRLIRAFTARWQPAIDAFTHHPAVQRFAPALADPDLWHLTRRSTARAVAVGLFCGLVPGPLQMISAAAVAVLVRANFPLAVVTTLYTNPFTIVPLYLLAYEIGHFVLPGSAASAPFVAPPEAGPIDFLWAVLHWTMAMGKPLVLGLVVLASMLAVAGWAAVHIGWRVYTTLAWRRRAAMRRPAP